MKVAFEINKQLSDDDRNRLLACIPDLEWGAVRQFLLEHIESATQYATDEGVAKEHGSVAYYAGSVGALRLLFASLETYRDRGGQIQEK